MFLVVVTLVSTVLLVGADSARSEGTRDRVVVKAPGVEPSMECCAAKYQKTAVNNFEKEIKNKIQ